LLGDNGVQVTETTLADEGELLDERERPTDDGCGCNVMNGQPTKYRNYTPGGANYPEVLPGRPEKPTQGCH